MSGQDFATRPTTANWLVCMLHLIVFLSCGNDDEIPPSRYSLAGLGWTVTQEAASGAAHSRSLSLMGVWEGGTGESLRATEGVLSVSEWSAGPSGV